MPQPMRVRPRTPPAAAFLRVPGAPGRRSDSAAADSHGSLQGLGPSKCSVHLRSCLCSMASPAPVPRRLQGLCPPSRLSSSSGVSSGEAGLFLLSPWVQCPERARPRVDAPECLTDEGLVCLKEQRPLCRRTAVLWTDTPSARESLWPPGRSCPGEDASAFSKPSCLGGEAVTDAQMRFNEWP